MIYMIRAFLSEGNISSGRKIKSERGKSSRQRDTSAVVTKL